MTMRHWLRPLAPTACTWANTTAPSRLRARARPGRDHRRVLLRRSAARVDGAAQGADYLAFGAFYPSTTKPLARHAPLDLLQRARAIGLPQVAIGGITPENARFPDCRRRRLIAVISGVFDAPDPVAARASLRRLLRLEPASFKTDIQMDPAAQHLFARAQTLMPGGVNSPVRAFKSVGGEPFFVQRAEGAYLRRRRQRATSTTSAPGAR